MRIILNNREELFDWIKEHITYIYSTAYINKLEQVEHTLIIEGGSMNGGSNNKISYPCSYELYPVEFDFKMIINEEFDTSRFSNVINGWLLKMIIRELIKTKQF